MVSIRLCGIICLDHFVSATMYVSEAKAKLRIEKSQPFGN
jgi:hypothetical protein